MAYDPALEAFVDQLGTDQMQDAINQRGEKQNAERDAKKNEKK